MADKSGLTCFAMFKNIFAVYGVKWLWVTLIVTVMGALLTGSIVPANVADFSASVALLKVFGLWPVFSENPGLTLFMLLIFAPFIEEAIFRLLPLTLVKDCRPQIVRAVVIVVCGIGFGWAHGSPLNVFIQGVGGALLGCLYLANGKSQLHSYLSCVFVHAAYNLTVVLTAMG